MGERERVAFFCTAKNGQKTLGPRSLSLSSASLFSQFSGGPHRIIMLIGWLALGRAPPVAWKMDGPLSPSKSLPLIPPFPFCQVASPAPPSPKPP